MIIDPKYVIKIDENKETIPCDTFEYAEQLANKHLLKKNNDLDVRIETTMYKEE